MWFRLRRQEFGSNKGRENKAALKALVGSGERPGLIAYVDGEPAGWCSLDPREKFAHLARSRQFKRVDNQPVWSIVCFVIGERFRRQGLMTRLLEEAVSYAAQRGARIIEGYPVEPEGRLTGTAGYTGIASVFRRAGFIEVARAANGRPVMRYYVR
jgi:GNAT superfamily N-acetyltransferase